MTTTYTVVPMTHEAPSHVASRGRLASTGVLANARVAVVAWGHPSIKGTSVPAAGQAQRMAPTPTIDIRGVVVFDGDPSGSRNWSPPV